MYKTLLPVLRELWKAPEGKQVVGLCFIIAFGVPLFLGFYYGGVMEENASLKIELKQEREKNENIKNEYLSKIIEVQNFHINKFNDYRDKVEAKDAERSKQLEHDYKEAVRTIYQTKKVIDRTRKGLGNNNN